MAHQQFCFPLLTFLHAIWYAVMFHYTNDLNRREREYIPAVVKIVYLPLKCVCCCNVIELSYVPDPIPLFNKIVSHYPVSAIWCGIIAVLRKKTKKQSMFFYEGLEGHAKQPTNTLMCCLLPWRLGTWTLLVRSSILVICLGSNHYGHILAVI